MAYWSRQTETERALIVGMFGPPELKRGERKRFLGEFAERVLAAISKDDVAADEVDRSIAKAMKDPRATAVVVHADVEYTDAAKYHRLATEQGLPFTMRGDPSYTGKVGLVVISDRAVH